MKGFMSKGLITLGMTSGLAAVGGCECYRNLVDPCYPDRYESAARHEVMAAFAPQVSNGHFLDQTVWNYHFEPGTEKLTPGGKEHLTYLARRRPYPDCTVFLATAHEPDITYDPAAPDKYNEQRTNLDERRKEAIQKYLAAETAGRPVSFEVVVHDPAEVGIAAQPAGISIGKMYLGAQGILGPTAGLGAPGGAAGSGPASGAAAGGAPAAPPR